MLPEIPAKDDTDDDLTGKLIAFDQTAVLPPFPLLLELQVVVEHADSAHPQHDEHRDEHIGPPQAEFRPEQNGNDRASEDDQTTHRGRRTLRRMGIWRALANHLIHRLTTQRPQ